jgi:hypothetical protein
VEHSRSRISIQDPTCRGLSSSVDALRIEPYSFEVAFYAQCCMPTSQNFPSRHWCENRLGGGSFSWFRGGPARAMGHLGE